MRVICRRRAVTMRVAFLAMADFDLEPSEHEPHYQHDG